MKAFFPRQFIFVVAAWVAGSVVGLQAAPAQAFTPYRLLLQAVRSPQSPMAFVADKRLKANLRAALVAAEPGTVLSVKAYVAGGHGYLVGWVKDDAQRARLEDAARQVAGLISLAVYLPVKPTGDDAPSSSAELELKAKLTASLRLAMGGDTANIAVDVLGDHAVLVGVLGSTGKIQHAAQAARETSGVSGVTSFLTVPLSGDTKRIGILQ